MECSAIMSRDWTGREFVNASLLWEFIDTQSAKIDMCHEDSFVGASECIKLVLFGKKEMLSAFVDFICEHETTLKEIVDGHGLSVSED
jgi:hypothetical protein